MNARPQLKHQRPRETKQQAGALLDLSASEGIVEAIVSVFGVLDEGGDIVVPGAYAKTITERGRRIRVLDHHNSYSVRDVIGVPLAMRELSRDELPAEILSQWPEATGGLWTKTQYLLNTEEGAGVFARIASGALAEYSIGYQVMQASYQDVDWRGSIVPVRLLKEIKLWEYSPVVWGMNPATATVQVKAAETDVRQLSDNPAAEPVEEEAPSLTVQRRRLALLFDLDSEDIQHAT